MPTTTEHTAHSTMPRKRTLAVGWVSLFFVGTDLFVVSPLLPEIAASFRVPVATAGFVVSAFSLAYALIAPWFGALGDRIDHARVLVLGLAVFSLAEALTAMAGSFPLLLAARTLAGASVAAITPSIYTLVGNTAPQARRGLLLSVVGSGLLFALVTGAPGGALLSAVLGWHSVFIVLAVAAAALVPINRATWPRGAHLASRGLQNSGSGIRMVSLTALWAFALYGMYTYLGTIAVQHMHWSAGAVASLVALFGTGAVTGNLVGGVLADRVPHSRLITASFALMAVTLLAGVRITQQPFALTAILAFLWSFFAYAYFPAQQSRIVHAFPAARGALLAWNISALYVGITAGSAIGGQIFHHLGVRALYEMSATAAALGAVLNARWFPGNGARAPAIESRPAPGGH